MFRGVYGVWGFLSVLCRFQVVSVEKVDGGEGRMRRAICGGFG